MDHFEVVKLLLNDPRIDLNLENIFGETAFFFACANGTTETVKLLLQHEKLDINKTGSKRTPLIIACLNHQLEVIELILESGREVDLFSKTVDNKTALDIAKEEISRKQEYWESDDFFEKRKSNSLKIEKLLESFIHKHKNRIKITDNQVQEEDSIFSKLTRFWK